MRIGRRLRLSFDTLLLAPIVASIGFFSVTRIHGDLKTVYEDRAVPLRELGDINRWMQRNRILVMDMIANPDPANVEKRDVEAACDD